MSAAKPSLIAQRDESLVARITGSFELVHRSGWFVRAGSSLVSVGERLLAVQDDALAAVWITPATRALEATVLGGTGGELSKSAKPDFEAAFEHAGTIWILGSGAAPGRRRFARLDPGREPVLLDRGAVYDAVTAALSASPNIEGALAVGDRLRLFQRGPGRRRGENFLVDLPLDVLDGRPPRVVATVACDLGTIGGLHLGFTDAALLPGGRILYLAVAEDTFDGIADGPITGAAVGILDPGSASGAGGDSARWNVLTEADGAPSRRKVEGVALDSAGSGWLLTDPDDATRPAELCRVELKF